jgi:hypothetical protein
MRPGGACVSLYCSNVMRVEAIFPRSGRWGFYDGNGAFNAHDYWARRRRATAEQDPVGAPVWPWQSRSQPVPYLWRLVHRSVPPCVGTAARVESAQPDRATAPATGAARPHARISAARCVAIEFGLHAAVVAPSLPIVRQPVARAPIASGSARRRSRQRNRNIAPQSEQKPGNPASDRQLDDDEGQY